MEETKELEMPEKIDINADKFLPHFINFDRTKHMST